MNEQADDNCECRYDQDGHLLGHESLVDIKCPSLLVTPILAGRKIIKLLVFFAPDIENPKNKYSSFFDAAPTLIIN
jgi:hypothetical protein